MTHMRMIIAHQLSDYLSWEWKINVIREGYTANSSCIYNILFLKLGDIAVRLLKKIKIYFKSYRAMAFSPF